jgi:hypothetical protein
LMRPGSVHLFKSIDLWDICALIASSRAYCGSSLHGRVVATAFALPRVNVRHPVARGHQSKQAAFAATWDQDNLPAVVDLRDIAAGIRAALAADPEQLQHTARRLSSLYRQAFSALCPGLT